MGEPGVRLLLGVVVVVPLAVPVPVAVPLMPELTPLVPGEVVPCKVVLELGVPVVMPVLAPVVVPVVVEAPPTALPVLIPPPAPYGLFVEKSSLTMALVGTTRSSHLSIRKTLRKGVRDSCEAQPATIKTRPPKAKNSFMIEPQPRPPSTKWGKHPLVTTRRHPATWAASCS
jgi:hypothetical protein